MSGRHESDAGAVTGMEAATIRDQARRLAGEIESVMWQRWKDECEPPVSDCMCRSCLLKRSMRLLRVVAE